MGLRRRTLEFLCCTNMSKRDSTTQKKQVYELQKHFASFMYIIHVECELWCGGEGAIYVGCVKFRIKSVRKQN